MLVEGGLANMSNLIMTHSVSDGSTIHYRVVDLPTAYRPRGADSTIGFCAARVLCMDMLVSPNLWRSSTGIDNDYEESKSARHIPDVHDSSVSSRMRRWVTTRNRCPRYT